MSGRGCRYRREGGDCDYGCTAERTLCHHYARRRSCLFGDSCRYQTCHPRHQLGTTSSNLNAERRQDSVSRSPRPPAKRAAERAAGAESDSDGRITVIACRLLPRFVGPLTEDQTNAAMSHNSFDDIAHSVTEFLTRHPETWWIDKHYGMCIPSIRVPAAFLISTPTRSL